MRSRIPFSARQRFWAENVNVPPPFLPPILATPLAAILVVSVNDQLRHGADDETKIRLTCIET